MRHRKENLHAGYERRGKDDLRNLAASVLLYEKVLTTKARAKKLKAIVDKMITLGKKGDLSSIRRLNSYFWDRNVARKIVEDLVPKFTDRNSGYTRVVKIGKRVGDGAPKVLVELLIPHKEKRREKIKKKTAKVTRINKKEIEKKKPEREEKNWFERARDFGKRIGRRDTKITTRTTSK